MSLEKDITEIQKDIFAPASKADLVSRKEKQIEVFKKDNPERWAALQAVHNFKPEEHKYAEERKDDPFDNYISYKSPNMDISDGFAITVEDDIETGKIYFRASCGSGRTFSALDFNKANEKYGGFHGNTPEEAYNQYIAAFKKFEAALRELGMIK